jgi:two-component system chemotaxis response regulator CheY
LKEIRKDDKLKHIPVLLVTAETRTVNIVEAIKSGVTDFIAKPFTPHSLEIKLNKIWTDNQWPTSQH